MKQLRYIFASCILFFNSCSILDIEPVSEWNAAAVPTEYNHVEAILYGGYQRLGSVLLTGFIHYGDARADVYYANTTTAVTMDKIIHSHLENELSQANWQNFYLVVKQANLNIHYIPQLIESGVIKGSAKIDGTSTDLVESAYNILGQSYVMRAYTYFWMTRIWGGLPLILDPIFSADEEEKMQLTRSSIEDVFTQIYADLDEAERYLADSKSAVKNPTVFSYWAARALRAQAYMWQHRYAEALPVLDDIIANGDYTLADLYDASLTLKDNGTSKSDPTREAVNKSGFSKMFNTEGNSGSPESIFELSFSTADGDTNNTFDSMWVSNAQVVIREDFISIFDNTTDFRYYASIALKSSNKQRVTKFTRGYTKGDSRNVILMRLADFILLRAEARLCATEGDLTDADKEAIVADVNQVINRAMGPAHQLVNTDEEEIGYQNFTKEEFFDRIKTERRKELAFEGQRWFDLVRWGDVNKALGAMVPAELTTYVFDTGALQLYEGDSFESGQLVWPIHLNEIRRSNGRIEQNEYYK